MKTRWNSISVVPVRALEIGDLIAFETVGDVASGKVTGKVYSESDATEEQKQYMRAYGIESLTFPDEDGGSNLYLLFGEFHGHPNHVYLGFDVNVAVFHNSTEGS